MRLGLDFGTTHSSIALFDGDTLHPIVVEPASENPHLLPSLLYVPRDGAVQVGTQAAEAYLREETGRPVLWRRRDAGEIITTIASWDADPIEFLQATSVMVDEAANGRLLQSIKAGLFNARYAGTQIFGRFYRLEELIAPILERLKAAATAQLGEPCTSIVLGRPVKFAEQPLADARAEAVLLKAAWLAGLRDVRFEREPVGVAHLIHRTTSSRQTVLVFDFGGGTLDMTLAEVGGHKPPQIRATTGVLVGGDDLDRRIMGALLPRFGGGDDGLLPGEMSDKLLAWSMMPELSRPHELERIRQLQRETGDPALDALETLVTHNLGFRLFKEVERVKIALSSQPSERLTFTHGAIQLDEMFTRRRFERLIAPELDAIDAGLNAVLREAKIAASSVDVVLRTGGSSLIPAVYRLLAARFGEDRQRGIDPLTSVVGGFAVRAYEEDQAPPRPFRPIIRAADDTGQLSIGARCYTDRDYIVSRLPAALNGLPYLPTRNQDRDAALEFELTAPARVYVAFDDAANLPDWLRTFTPEPMQIDISDDFALIERTLRVYGRDFPAGTVTLGGAKDALVNYLVIAR